MSKGTVDRSVFDQLGPIIREKLGTDIQYTPSQMPAAVQSIPTGITPAGTVNITQNGTHDVTEYANANVNVQPTLQSKTATQNGTVTPDSGYDGLSQVVVEVSGGVTPSSMYLLDPDLMDAMAAACPTADTTNIYLLANLAFTPYVVKINNTAQSDYRSYWYSQKGTYAGVSNVAFLGRRGFDRSGLILATKIPHGVYSKLNVRYEITSGSFTGGYLRLDLINSIAYGSDVWPDSANILYTQTLATGVKADNTEVIDISSITSDFYVYFGDYSGFVKLRSIWLEV